MPNKPSNDNKSYYPILVQFFFSIFSYFWSFGPVLAIEKLWQSTTFDRMNRVIVKPGSITRNYDVVGLVCYVIVVLDVGNTTVADTTI